MVDLPMMARLLDALPRHARLILLGDRISSPRWRRGRARDICSFIEQGISPAQAGLALPPDRLSPARHAGGASVRDSPVCWPRAGALTSIRASASWRGPATAATGGGGGGLGAQDWRYPPAPWAGRPTTPLIARGGRLWQLPGRRPGPGRSGGGVQGIQRLPDPLRPWDGSRGDGAQRAARTGPAKAGLIQRDGDWYAGRPVMVVRNDHGVGLYNGDMGLCLPG